MEGIAGKPATAAPSAASHSPTDQAAATSDQTEQQRIVRERTDALLRDLWQRKRPMVRDQIQTLRRAAATLEAATLTTPLRAEAAVAAHKLAGSLGMFGYHEGTRCARELEAMLDADESPSATVFAGLLEQLVASLASA